MRACPASSGMQPGRRISNWTTSANKSLKFAEQYQLELEQGATHRVLGEVYQAMGNRAEADAAFRRSLEILGEIQSRPELAQTLLAYGRFRRGDNAQEDRALIKWDPAGRAALAVTGRGVFSPSRVTFDSGKSLPLVAAGSNRFATPNGFLIGCSRRFRFAPSGRPAWPW
jgi:hypothetical protein